MTTRKMKNYFCRLGHCYYNYGNLDWHGARFALQLCTRNSVFTMHHRLATLLATWCTARPIIIDGNRTCTPSCSKMAWWKCSIVFCRVPEHLDGIPILALESNPEFETDPERAKKMIKEVSSATDYSSEWWCICVSYCRLLNSWRRYQIQWLTSTRPNSKLHTLIIYFFSFFLYFCTQSYLQREVTTRNVLPQAPN